MNKLTLLLFFITLITNAQIKGKITDASGQGIPFVSVAVENTYNNTTANENGGYELAVKQTGSYNLVFQSIGFKTKKITVNAATLPYTLDVKLEDEKYELKELVIDNAEDPAYAIIRQAIAHKKENSEKSGRFEADFYSKGIFRVANLPKKIMGMKVETPEGYVDSTGSGVMYLSETVSHITFEQPDNLKEKVIASKVSGSDNGFSYNTALGTFYNFYDDYIDFEVKMVSPIGKGALGYYKYKFEGSSFDEQGHEIDKIKVIPRRDKEPVFEGYIYIVNGSFALYAIDLDIKGYRVQIPPLKTLTLKQNFSFNADNGLWAKNSQTFDFDAGMFGINFTGKFTHVYSNYIFHDKFEKKTFGREVVSFEKDANKKDSVYWNTVRPVPLTLEETKDYTKKDSISTKLNDPVRLDSIAKARNKFHILDVITGYTYHKTERDTATAKNVRFEYGGFDLPSYNTVQGWNTGTRLSYSRWGKKIPYFAASANFNYGLAEDRLRVKGSLSRSFKKVGAFTVGGGTSIEQFNPNEPITPLVNTVSSLVFKDNYMKLYDKQSLSLGYGRSAFSWLYLNGVVEYSRRKALYNNTDYVLIKDNDVYTSNDPLQPYNYTSAPIETQYVTKATISGNIRWPYKYISYPNGGKMPVGDENYPKVSFQYQKAFAANLDKYKYDFVSVAATYNTSLSNKGDFGIGVNAGKFFGADGISFVDYKHFNGNQTHFTEDEAKRLKSFNMLPYYTNSTNNAYLELHTEHNFKGYIMNKIPVLNLLQWNLIVGYHSLITPDRAPYHEFTAGFSNIGIGAFRVLRVDYVHSYQAGVSTNGVMFSMGL
jgi:Family of unknown function (DUF5686)/CarboxypepD_reg-like domain